MKREGGERKRYANDIVASIVETLVGQLLQEFHNVDSYNHVTKKSWMMQSSQHIIDETHAKNDKWENSKDDQEENDTITKEEDET